MSTGLQYVTDKDLAEQVTTAHNALRLALYSGLTYPTQVGIYREKWLIMEQQWREERGAVKQAFGGACVKKDDKLIPWHGLALKYAEERVSYESTKPERRARLDALDWRSKSFLEKLIKKYVDFFAWWSNEFTGLTVLTEPNPNTAPYLAQLRAAFAAWFKLQIVTERFLNMSPPAVLGAFFEDRVDMQQLFTFVQQAPRIRTEIQREIQVPFMVEVLEMAISLTPFLGNTVAAWESHTGYSIFGYKLSDAERAIMAACIILPIARKLYKNGRLMYSEARLAAMYGGTEDAWSKTTVFAAKPVEQPLSANVLNQAAAIVKSQKKLEGRLAKEAVEAVGKIMDSPGRVPIPVEPEVEARFKELSKRWRFMEELDVHALRRIVTKKKDSAMQGQLLEELAVSYVMPWLRDRAGGYALGVKVPKGATLDFFPGHVIKSGSNAQISDGLLGYFQNDIFHIVAIVEVKSGKKGRRELLEETIKAKNLNDKERKELRAVAKEVWEEEAEMARREGKRYTKTVEQIERELPATEPGQIRRDIERLDQLFDGKPMQLNIEGQLRDVKLVSPTRTKIFGIVPKGVRLDTLEQEIRAQGHLFEAIGVSVRREELKKIVKELQPLADKLLAEPPKAVP